MFQSILVLDHILPFRSFIFSFIPKFGSCRTKPEKGVYDGQRWKESQSKKKHSTKKKQVYTLYNYKKINQLSQYHRYNLITNQLQFTIFFL